MLKGGIIYEKKSRYDRFHNILTGLISASYVLLLTAFVCKIPWVQSCALGITGIIVILLGQTLVELKEIHHKKDSNKNSALHPADGVSNTDDFVNVLMDRRDIERIYIKWGD